MNTKIKFSDYLMEAPLPDDWDGALYNERIPFSKRIKYAQQRAKTVGSGSGRVAFVIPYQGRDTVLKIAKNAKGAAQNEVEVQYLDDYILKDYGIIIPLIDYDEANSSPTWIHIELAGKAKDSDFKAACGGTLKDLMSWVCKQVSRRDIFYGNSNAINPESELAQALVNFVGNFDVNIGDFGRLANWGIYKGRPVIIDVGLSDDVYSQYYNKTRR